MEDTSQYTFDKILYGKGDWKEPEAYLITFTNRWENYEGKEEKEVQSFWVKPDQIRGSDKSRLCDAEYEYWFGID